MAENFRISADLMQLQKKAHKIARFLEIPSLELHLKVAWGTENEKHRDEIRESLEKHRRSIRYAGDSSISHAEGLGGYALLSFLEPDCGLGLDVELASRIREEVARRVCFTEAEFRAAPSFASLWCAKEAAFKALKGDQQPKTIMQVEIFGWGRKGELESFQFRVPENPGLGNGKGLGFSPEPPHQVAVALINRRKS